MEAQAQKEIGKVARQHHQGNTVNDLVYDPRTGTFIEKAHADVTDQDQVCTVMTREGFAYENLPLILS